MGPLDGRHALVTGGGSGIGAAIACALADAGAAVTIAGRDTTKLDAVARDLKCATVVADITLEADCEAMIAIARDNHGPIDIVIANAGAAAYQPMRVESTPLAGGAVQARLVPVDPAYPLTYDPRSRNVGGRGTIGAPNVDVTDELVETLSAKLAFEANLKVVSTAADLEKRSIDLLG